MIKPPAIGPSGEDAVSSSIRRINNQEFIHTNDGARERSHSEETHWGSKFIRCHFLSIRFSPFFARFGEKGPQTFPDICHGSGSNSQCW